MLLSLQGCRFLAALLVVMFHAASVAALDKYFAARTLEPWFRFGGGVGVEFFFVLSGFIITEAHRLDFGRPERLKRYALRRAFRIYPAYWLVFLLMAGTLAVMGGGNILALPAGVTGWLASLSLWPQDPAVVGGTGSPVLAVAWSLQYEMMFYVAVGCAIAGRRWVVTAVAALLCWAWVCRELDVSWPLAFVRPWLLALFAFGAAASVVARQWPIAHPLPWVWAFGAGWCAFVVYAIGASWSIWPSIGAVQGMLLHGLLCAGLIVGLVKAERHAALVCPGWFNAAGGMSYALYLVHFPIVSAVCKALMALGATGLAGAAIAMLIVPVVAVTLAWGLWRGFERPVQDALHRRFLTAPSAMRAVRP